jgi:hypothetical protein
MSEEEQVVAVEQAEEPAEAKTTVTEEIKVQAQDLFKALNDIIREGTARRVMVLRNDRVLIDIPLVAGVAAGVLLAVYMTAISAIVAAGALIGGCTVRIVREEPPDEA